MNGIFKNGFGCKKNARKGSKKLQMKKCDVKRLSKNSFLLVFDVKFMSMKGVISFLPS